MKITLYMAISADGFIAKSNGDSDWVSPLDADNFDKAMKDAGCIIVGRKTFDQFQGELYPVEGVMNFVVTSQNSLPVADKNVHYVSSPQEALNVVLEKRHKEALLIGGGTVNGLFLDEDLIDEVILSVHPLILGEGISLFENTEKTVQLKLLEQKTLGEGLIQLHYKVLQ